MSDNDFIRISHDDLNSPEVIERQNQLEQASKVSQQRVIGQPNQMKSTSAIKEVLIVTLFGALGGFGAWILYKMFEVVFALEDADDPTASNIAFTAFMALSIGLLVSLAEAVSTRSWAKAGLTAAISLPIALVLGLLVGFLADIYYSGALESIYNEANDKYFNGDFATDEAAFQWILNRIHLPRGLAWTLVGLAAGLTAGIASRAWKKALLASGGGMFGGFAGGFLFDYIATIPFLSDGAFSEIVPQIFGMSLTGTLIGVGMSALEQASKTRWIEIVAGGLAGKQFILYRHEITLGSSTQADITLIKDPQILPITAKISSVGSQVTISSSTGAPIDVNGVSGTYFPLGDGSRIQLGTTVIVYRERSGNAVPAAPINRNL